MQKSTQRKGSKRLRTNWGEEDGVECSRENSQGRNVGRVSRNPLEIPPRLVRRERFGETHQRVSTSRSLEAALAASRAGFWFLLLYFLNNLPINSYKDRVACGVDEDRNESLGWGRRGFTFQELPFSTYYIAKMCQ